MNFSLTNQERLDLKRLLSSSSDYSNTTELIRHVKHSTSIQKEVMDLAAWMKSKPKETNFEDTNNELEAQQVVPFLYGLYPDLFKKVLHNEIDFRILDRVIQVLQGIEDGKVDQHEGSVLVSKVLKELYLDSAVRHGDNLDKKYESNQKPKYNLEKQISWKTYRSQSMKK
jgi:hypothetical protein